MTKFINVFPLGIVVFPGESLPLHIFEPRYKQLISESVLQKKTFGIPIVIDSILQEFGCSVVVDQLIKEYPNGEMDIIVKGQEVFRLLEFVETIPDKLYSGAIISFPENQLQPTLKNKMVPLQKKITALYEGWGLLDKLPDFKKIASSYQLGHLIGLTLNEELDFLQIFNEDERINYLLYFADRNSKEHKANAIVKNKIRMNGHFRLEK
jgi:uncharacterized protein